MASDGHCAIKAEFVIKRNEQKNNTDETNGDEPEHKRRKVEDDEKGKPRARGQNKGRPKFIREANESRPCPSIINVRTNEAEVPECKFKTCSFIHDPVEYMRNKPTDALDSCYVYESRGECPWGLSCRYGASHLTPEGRNIVDEAKLATWTNQTVNSLEFDTLLKLQRRKYDFDHIEKYVRGVSDEVKRNKTIKVENSGTVTDEDVIKPRPCEKKPISWNDKLYLGPLTTLGNLPFRRICKEYGADITCGEMVMCDSLLKGTKQEWALVKRHATEDIFGVQICGTNPFIVSKVASLINKEIEVDFVDLNLGCPIDLVYKKGGGCGMLQRTNILEATVRCASSLLDVPFTVKTRTGVQQETKIAHLLAPKFFEWGASMLTVHGRSREQRYTKFSDWEYINQCAKLCQPRPVFGNGDILSHEDYCTRRERAPDVAGTMICRGGLIKPWIFKEIKEQKLWDISSGERFDILKKYTNYGLEHWGSDSRGVENTRRFMLEWCSFLYRYIPVGLLERPPQKINERPPYYFGRDDLETLMASPNCADWIKLSEMLLGPVPEGFQFLPKHKANSYS